MPNLREFLGCLHGTWRLLLLDRRGGLAAFDGTRGAAWRSFWAALLVFPLLAIAHLIPIHAAPGATAEPSYSFAVYALVSVISWLLPLGLTYALLRWYGRHERFWLLISVLNWSQPLQALALVLAIALIAVASNLVNLQAPETAPAAALLTTWLLLNFKEVLITGSDLYEWYVSWTTLEAGIALPLAIVLLDKVIGKGLFELIHHWPWLVQPLSTL